MNIDDCKKFHDATFLSIEVNWKDAEIALIASLQKNGVREIYTLTFYGFTRLICPRICEWGESVSINKISLDEPVTSNTLICKIEIQSGDIIEIIASEMHMQRKLEGGLDEAKHNLG